MLTILGYAAATCIGMIMGLVGAGGAILAVPILVYMFHIPAVQATGYSLFVVGATSFTGMITYIRRDLVSYRTAVIYALPSFTAVFIARKFIIPAIPEHILSIGSLTLTKNAGLLILFALLMGFASIAMIRNGRQPEKKEDDHPQHFNYPLIFVSGFFIGLLTGMVGAGGGFMIIPVLVILAELPMKLAIGTSLTIIASNSIIGFIGDLSEQPVINWPFLLSFTLLAVSGIFIGNAQSKRISGQKLKPIFGWFVLFIGLYVLIRELIGSFT